MDKLIEGVFKYRNDFSSNRIPKFEEYHKARVIKFNETFRKKNG